MAGLCGSGPPQQALTPKHHGVTKPLSLAGPTEADLLKSKDLEKVGLFVWLSPLKCFELNKFVS